MTGSCIFVTLRRGVLLCAAGLCGVAPPAAAQESAEVEEVVVTGSRISRANETQPNPVYGLDSEDVKLSGQLNMVDIMDDLPQLFTSDNAAQSDFFTQDGLNNTPGLARLNLRGLGANRTLVLVDGKRHVSGQAGSAAVDIGTIPAALVERVEVLTGGASSIYGADAVTGVVNFIMKENFEGTEVDVQGGFASESGGEEAQLSITHGQNFLNDRLNITVSGSVRRREFVITDERDWSRNSGIAGRQNNNWRNVFQPGDSLPAGASVGDAVSMTDANGSCTPSFAGTDPSLVDRGCNSRPQSIERNLRFGLTSPLGLVSIALADDPFAATPEAAGSFPFFHSAADAAGLAAGTPFMDFNGNGIDDCEESVIGLNAVGGCVVVDSNGSVRPFNPGLIDGTFTNFDAIGGDGSPQNNPDNQSLDPSFEQYVGNVSVDFDINDRLSFFTDLKYIKSMTRTTGGTIAFFDTINISRDNPFVPQQLQTLMNDIIALNPQFADTAQFFVSRDPEDINNDGRFKRETVRVVTGLEGDFDDNWSWELAYNYGRTEETARDRALLNDRWFAALDVVDDGNGNAVCRSEVEAGWTVDDFNNDSLRGDAGVNTFTPGDGSCAPANPFGLGSISPESQRFIAPFRQVDDEIEQQVVSFIVTGDTDQWFALPGGAIGLAGGFEYRKETATSTPDALEQAGFYFNSQTSPNSGEFEVSEFFVEASAPLLADVFLARELTVDAAYRYSDYDLNVGDTNTWSVGLSWTPIEDVRLRATASRAVRAPNIFELFNPQTGSTFNLDIDPCDQSEIDAISVSDPTTGAQRAANCAADPLVGANFTNPLTSNFQGVTGGNPDLIEETSDTQTIGLVLTPRFVEGLVMTVDYWNIEIEDAIDELEDEDILRGCYDGPAPDPNFCSLFTRVSDPSSGFFGGLNFLQTGQVNFARLEASGVDTEVVYNMDLLDGSLMLRANATYLDKLDEFRSVLTPNIADPEAGEIQRPEWAGNFNARWGRDQLTLGYQARYIGNQALRLVETNTIDAIDNSQSGVLWVHDLSASYDFSDRYSFYGGIQNVTDEAPFATQPSFPTGTRGRYFFFGVTATL